ncbi:MAG: hypothetical protein ACR2KT_01945 [Methylocella sp.]
MTKKPKDNSVGPWAKEKLQALGQYLSFYTTVLKKQGHWLRGTIFVDAFAGPGLSRVRTREKAAEPPGLFGPDPESTRPKSNSLRVRHALLWTSQIRSISTFLSSAMHGGLRS